MLPLFIKHKLPTIILVFFVLLNVFYLKAQPKSEVCISPTEMELYHLIMKYRKSKKLSSIPLSPSLTFVAQAHSKDLFENKTDKAPCNLHSWSDKGNWSSCCYYPDHRNKEFMWNKPKELTTYQGHGYEIAYFHSAEIFPEEALDAWQKSPGHNMVIVNLNSWKAVDWNAIGIGIYKNYVTIWFGAEKDTLTEVVKICPE